MSLKIRSWPRGAVWFVCLWSIMLLFPPLSRITLQCWDWNHAGALTPRRSYRHAEAPPFDAALIRARHTNDPHFLAQALEAQINVAARANDVESPYYWERMPDKKVPDSNNYMEVVEGYLVLVQRYPDEEWLRVRALEMLAQLRPPAYVAPRSGGEKTPGVPLKAAQRALVIQAMRLASASGKRFPDNAFFPLLESAFNLNMGHDAQAMEALHRAANAKSFDNFTAPLIRDRLQAAALEAPLEWEDRNEIAVQFNSFDDRSFADVGLAATQMGIDAWKRGDGREAVGVWDDVALVAQKLNVAPNQPFHLLGGGRGRWMESYLWITVTKTFAHGSLDGIKRTDYGGFSIVASQAFAQLCRESGRPDMAERATRAALDYEAQENEFRNQTFINETPGFFAPQRGSSGPRETFAFAGRFAGGFLLRLILLGMVLWGGLLCWVRPGHASVLRRLDVMAASLFCVVAVGVGWYLQAANAADFNGDADSVGQTRVVVLDNNQASPYFAWFVAPYVLTILPAAFFAWRQARRERLNDDSPDDAETVLVDQKAKAFAVGGVWLVRLWWLTGVWFVALFLVPVAAWETLFADWFWMSDAIFLLLLISAVVWTISRLRAEIRPKVSLLLGGLVLPHFTLLALAIARQRPLFPYYTVWNDIVSYGAWTLTIGCVVGALVWMARDGNWPSLRAVHLELPLPRRFFVVYGEIARHFALGCTVLFFLLALALWPIRARVEADFQKTLYPTQPKI